MASKRDERNPDPRKRDQDTPRKPRSQQEPVSADDLDELEVVDELEIVDEAPPARKESKPAPSDVVGKKAARPSMLSRPQDEEVPAKKEDKKKTQLAKRSSTPTTLAPADELEEVIEAAEVVEEPPAKREAAKGEAAKQEPAKQEPKKDSPKKTQLARRSPTPTVLAPADELEEVVEAAEVVDEEPGWIQPPQAKSPASPGKTRDEEQPKGAFGGIPNLSLDEPEEKEAVPVAEPASPSSVVEAAELVEEVEEAEVVEADVVEADVVEADVVEADVLDADVIEDDPRRHSSAAEAVDLVEDLGADVEHGRAAKPHGDPLSDVFRDEPVMAGSSLIEAAEIVVDEDAEEVGDDAHVLSDEHEVAAGPVVEGGLSESDVFVGEPVAAAEASSAAEAAEVVEDAEVVGEDLAQAAEAAPPMADDLFAAEGEEEAAEEGTIFDEAEEVEEPKPYSPSMARKEETIEEILEIAQSGEGPIFGEDLEDKPSKPAKFEDETVDLGSLPSMPAESTPKVKKAVSEEEVEWDEPLEEEAEAEPLQAGAADDMFSVKESKEVPEESSAVNLGQLPKGKKKDKGSGVDRLAEALESGVNLGDSGEGPSLEDQIDLEEIVSEEAEAAEEAAEEEAVSELADDSTDMDTAAVAEEGEVAEAVEEAEFSDEDLEGVEEVSEAEALEAGALEAEAEEAEAEDLEAEAAEMFGEDMEEAAAEEEAEAEAEAADFLMDEEAAEAEGEAEAAEAEAEEVVFDEGEAEAAEATSEDELADMLLDEEKPAPKGKKKAAVTAEEEEEVGAEALFEEDEAATVAFDEGGEFAVADEETEPVAVGAKKKKAKVEEEEEELFTEEDEEPAAKKKGRGRKWVAEEEEEGELVGAGAGGKPRYGRRWLGGMVLGTLILGGAAAGVWYQKPDLLQEAMIASPNYVAPKKVEPPKLSTAQQARTKMDQGDYDGALALLENATKDTPTDLAIRGEARWLKYLKERADKKEVPTQEDPPVQQALSDLREGKNDLLADQISRSLAAFAGLKEAEKTVQELHTLLVKAKVADPKAEPKELPAALGQALTAKQEAEDRVAGVVDALVKGKFLDDEKKFDVAAFKKLLDDLGNDKNVLAAVNKVLEKADVKDPGDKGVALLLAAKKDLDNQLEAVNKLLGDEKIKDGGAKGLQELIVARNQLAKDRAELDRAIKEAYKELADGNLAPPDGDPRAKIVEAVKQARSKAESPLAIPLTYLGKSLGGLGVGAGRFVENAFDYAALTAELSLYRAREPLIQAPDQKMDSYLALYQDHARQVPSEMAAALKDAAYVLGKDSKAKPADRAKALFVVGLIQRNQQKFDEARTSLQAALKETVLVKGSLAKQIEAALQELTDPAAYFLPRAERQAADGNVAEALDTLSRGLQALPGNAKLLARRSLLRVDSVLGAAQKPGKKIPADVEKAIRDDATAALKGAKDGADAAYALGLLEEALGHLNKAEEYYRQAIEMRQGEDASRYKIALARLLLRDRDSADADVPTEPAPKKDDAPKKDEDKKAAAADNADAEEMEPAASEISADDLRALLAIALVGVQPGVGLDEEEDPIVAARLKESIQLAEELIKSDDPRVKGQGYMLLGQALAKKGRHTEGMKEYVKGLQLYLGKGGDPKALKQAKDLLSLMENHPAFQQPDVSTKANPILAEQFFGKGLHLYWSRDYAGAEIQFKQAVFYYGLDARYQYYLGLSQLAQGTKLKRDAAYHAFEKGGKLEAENRPSTIEINASLERLQGPLRDFLNTFRQKALAAAD